MANDIVMDGLRLCYQGTHPMKEYYLSPKGSFYLVTEGKPPRKISEREALREYLDPSSMDRIKKPHLVFKSVHLVDQALDLTTGIGLSKFNTALVEFEITTDFKSHDTLKLTRGKLWPRQTMGVKL